LSRNENAISIIKKDLEFDNPLKWWINSLIYYVSGRKMYNVRWEYLSANPNAIDILEKNLDKVDWYNLSINNNDLNYEAIFKNTRGDERKL
jgi:hypothetical protein